MDALIFLLLFPFAILMMVFVGAWAYVGSPAGKKSGWSHSRLLKIFYDPKSFFGKDEGAKFLSDRETRKILNPRNRGMLVDGHNLRLSESDSFAHTLVAAPTAGGKSTRYIIPNVLTLAKQDCSLVITDPSGEVYEQTSGFLEKQGFDVQVISPANPRESLCYNPLARIRQFTDLEEIAKSLIMSANPGYSDLSAGDAFWYQGAEDVLKVLIRCLGKAGHKTYLNLPNLLHLLQNFGGDGTGLDPFIAKYGGEQVRNQWKGLIGGNEKVVQSFVSTAINSLSMLNNPDIASMMSTNEVDFTNLRKRKTAFFIIVPSEKLKYYSFILNLLYVDLFNTCMQELPKKAKAQGKPFHSIFALLDEFGHSSVPSFDMTLTTIRKYHVGISIVLQSISQLEARYGRVGAETILEGGIRNRIFLPGLSMKTSSEVEKMLGKQVRTEMDATGNKRTTTQNLLNADRIRTLDSDEMVFLSGNHEAMLLKTKPFYEQPNLRRLTSIPLTPFVSQRQKMKMNFVKIP